MNISEFACRVGLTSATVRFYESKGFFGRKRSSNNYRVYTESDVEEAELILLGKSLNFTLREIRDLSRELLSPKIDRAKVKLKLENHVAQIDSQIERLKQVRAMVIGRLDTCSR
jgi:DNA-binding transcriptional MerR regulator